MESPPRGRAIRFYSSPPEGGCGVSATIPHAIKIHSASASHSTYLFLSPFILILLLIPTSCFLNLFPHTQLFGRPQGRAPTVPFPDTVSVPYFNASISSTPALFLALIFIAPFGFETNDVSGLTVLQSRTEWQVCLAI